MPFTMFGFEGLGRAKRGSKRMKSRKRRRGFGKFGPGGSCGKAQWKRIGNRGRRCVRVCVGGRWKFVKGSECSRKRR